MRNLHIQTSVQKKTIDVCPFDLISGEPYLIGALPCVAASTYREGDAGVVAYAGFDAFFDVAFTADRGLFAPIYIREDNKLYDTQGAGGVVFGSTSRNIVLAKAEGTGLPIAATQNVAVEVGAGQGVAASAVAAGQAVPDDADGDGEEDFIDADGDGVNDADE